MNIDQTLREQIQKAVSVLFGQQVDALQIQPTNQEFEGSHTLVCFPLTKISRKGPEETAKLIGEYLVSNSSTVQRFNVVKGFLNLVLSDKVWIETLKSIFANPSYGQLPANGQEIMVEYSSPNTNKPLHLGHLRNNFLGWSVAEILKAAGFRVHKVQIINDRGIHICKSMVAWQYFGNGETPSTSIDTPKGDHLVGKYYVKFETEFRNEVKRLINAREIELPFEFYLNRFFEDNPSADIFIFDFEIGQITLKRGGNVLGFTSQLKENLVKLFEDVPKLAQANRRGANIVLQWLEPLYHIETLLVKAQRMLQKWEQKDPAVMELWKTMNSWVYAGFEETYKSMGVDFDKLYYESDTYLLGKEEVLKGVDSGVFFRKEDGSVWVDLTGDGLDQKVLLRSDGTSVYMTQDIGTAILRFRDFPNISGQIYTVGNEQEYHFKVLFLILGKLGFDWAKRCYHLSYGMVDLPTGKMKSREGTVVDADDLIAEITSEAEKLTRALGKVDELSPDEAKALFPMLGLGALKFFLLKVDPKKRMLFDPNESVQLQGFTGPFIQYTHARIRSILRKAESLGVDLIEIDFAGVTTLETAEVEVVKVLNQFENKVREAAKDYSPAVIANFVYDLAKTYNQFYQNIPIFNESDANKLQVRVALSKVVADAIRKAMHLLGIQVPERM
ncbi:MAG TPA: arginine--tRNA ligase [Chryseosolibacter sp.]